MVLVLDGCADDTSHVDDENSVVKRRWHSMVFQWASMLFDDDDETLDDAQLMVDDVAELE